MKITISSKISFLLTMNKDDHFCCQLMMIDNQQDHFFCGLPNIDTVFGDKSTHKTITTNPQHDQIHPRFLSVWPQISISIHIWSRHSHYIMICFRKSIFLTQNYPLTQLKYGDSTIAILCCWLCIFSCSHKAVGFLFTILDPSILQLP